MTTPDMSDTPFDWEEWPLRRVELTDAIAKFRAQLASLDARPELDIVRDASEKFIGDIENAIVAGDTEYRRLHPGAQFEPS
jgi:hypothetical protein